MAKLIEHTVGYTLPFEQPVNDLDKQLAQLEAGDNAQEIGEELQKLRESRDGLLRKIYDNLDPWDIVRVSRHGQRPQSSDYIQLMCRDFCELHGDRHFGDDPAMITGFGRIGPYKVMILAHQKGRTTDEKIACHFGCAHPEGYRKALKKMKLAEKFGLPVVSLIDTPGAYPGLKAEERGQAEAIAVNLREMSRLRTWQSGIRLSYAPPCHSSTGSSSPGFLGFHATAPMRRSFSYRLCTSVSGFDRLSSRIRSTIQACTDLAAAGASR